MERWRSRLASTETQSATMQIQKKNEPGKQWCGYLLEEWCFPCRYASNVDTKMVQLNFHDAENNPIGILNWFAVHPTSMNKTNKLISGDNKGAASLMMEKLMCPSELAGKYPLLRLRHVC